MNQLPAPAAMQQMEQPTKFHDVKVVKRKTVGKARVLGVPPEEFGIERQARSLRDCGYCFHRVIRRQADLINEGFDELQVRALPTYVVQTGVEELSRDTVNENTGTGGDKGLNVANRFVRIIEHYIRMDYEGDGKTKIYRVTTGGEIGEVLKRNKKLEIVEADDIPFASMTPIPVTHRFFGRSLADLVLDIQRIKTALTRGMLDNVYMSVNQRPEVAESLSGPSTLDDLLVTKPGSPIRVSQPGAITWQQIPLASDQILPVMEYMDTQREWRTGVSHQAQGPNADALSNTPATTAQLLYTAAQTKIRLIARIFAETGIRDMFSLLHETIRKHSSEASVVRLRNQWVNVDPRDWKRRDDLTIAVGRSGSKEAEMAAQQLIVQAQAQAVPAGLVSKRNLFNSAAHLTKLAGHKSPDEFFVDPSKPPDPNDPAGAPIPMPPDPKIAAEQAKAQLDQQQAMHKAQLDETAARADLMHQQAKNGAELELARQKAQFDMEVKALEARLKVEQMDKEFQHKQRMADLEHSHKQRMGLLKENTEGAKASIEVRHGADEMTGPLSDAIGNLGHHLMAHANAQTEALATLLKHANAPKRVIRGPDGKVSHVETIQ